MSTATKTVQHTPGPWSVGYSEQTYKDLGPNWWTVPVHVGEGATKGNALAVVYLGGSSATRTTQEEVEANARLIAAAPELLKESQAVIAEFFEEYEREDNYPDGPTCRAIQRLRAAIRKAKESQ